MLPVTLPVIFHLITFVSLYQKEQVIHFKFLIDFYLSAFPLFLFLVWLCWVFTAVWLLQLRYMGSGVCRLSSCGTWSAASLLNVRRYSQNCPCDLSEWLSSKNLQTVNAAVGVEKILVLLVGTQIDIATMGSSVEIP